MKLRFSDQVRRLLISVSNRQDGFVLPSRAHEGEADGKAADGAHWNGDMRITGNRCEIAGT